MPFELSAVDPIRAQDHLSINGAAAGAWLQNAKPPISDLDAGNLAMNFGSTPRWVWIVVALMAIAAAEYLMSPQIRH